MSRLFSSRRVNRYDTDNENEMLRKHFNNSIELDDENDDNDLKEEKKRVLNFYLSMMNREIYEPAVSDNKSLSYHHDSDEDKLALDDGHHCYPLCEKKFIKDDVLRRIFPCNHVFHDRCIQIWLYKGEHQFCPYCRGNIMKAQTDPNVLIQDQKGAA